MPELRETKPEVIENYAKRVEEEKQHQKFLYSLKYEKILPLLQEQKEAIQSLFYLVSVCEKNHVTQYPYRKSGLKIESYQKVRIGEAEEREPFVLSTRIRNMVFLTDGYDVWSDSIKNKDNFEELRYHATVRFVSNFPKLYARFSAFLDRLERENKASVLEKNHYFENRAEYLSEDDELISDEVVPQVLSAFSMKNIGNRMIYICTSLGEEKDGKKKLMKICEEICAEKNIPVCMHLYLSQLPFLKKEDEETLDNHLRALISKCDEILIIDKEISVSMRKEINLALDMKLSVQQYKSESEEQSQEEVIDAEL